MLGTSLWTKAQGGRYSTGCRKLRGQNPERNPSLYGSMEVLTCLNCLGIQAETSLHSDNCEWTTLAHFEILQFSKEKTHNHVWIPETATWH